MVDDPGARGRVGTTTLQCRWDVWALLLITTANTLTGCMSLGPGLLQVSSCVKDSLWRSKVPISFQDCGVRLMSEPLVCLGLGSRSRDPSIRDHDRTSAEWHSSSRLHGPVLEIGKR